MVCKRGQLTKKKEETPKKSSVHSWGDRKATSSITAGRFCRCAGVEAILADGFSLIYCEVEGEMVTC